MADDPKKPKSFEEKLAQAKRVTPKAWWDLVDRAWGDRRDTVQGLPPQNSTNEPPSPDDESMAALRGAQKYAAANIRNVPQAMPEFPSVEPDRPSLPEELSAEGITVAGVKLTSTEIFLAIAGGLFAYPLVGSGWHIVVEGEHIERGIVALLVGIPVGVFLIGFHWIRERFSERGREFLQRQSDRWAVPIFLVGFLTVFVYVTGPEIYRRATQPATLIGAIGVMPIGSTPIATKPPATAATPAEASRIYTNKTIQDLAAFYKGRTAMQADIFMADEKGKWIDTDGTLQTISSNGKSLLLSNGDVLISCIFDTKWKPKLNLFRPRESMKISGKISQEQQVQSVIYLDDCELR